jgi:signal transduction histidine kinase
MFAGRGTRARPHRVSPLAPPLGRRQRFGTRRMFAAAVAGVAVGTTIVSLEWILVSTPSALGLIFALCLGLIVYLELESRFLERQLRAARVRAVDAADTERQRIQRDLHDSAQQRLVSVRMHLALIAEKEDEDSRRESIDQLGRDLDAALGEIRAVTREGYPQLLLRKGVVDSLRSAATNAPMPVTIETDGFGRYPHRIERGVYFCCVEALQNAVKHAGRNAVARIRLVGARNRIVFEVEDSGVGFDPARVRPGEGLVNLADRVATMHGRLSIDSWPGLGTRIRGEIPVE